MSQFFSQWCTENLSSRKIELEMQHLKKKKKANTNENSFVTPFNTDKTHHKRNKNNTDQSPLQLEPRHPTCNFLEPVQIYKKLVYTGEKKNKQALIPFKWWMIFWQAIFAGIYIGLGDVLLLTVGAQSYGVKEENPGLYKILVGSFGLPFGLTLVVLTGAELFTSNTCYLSAAFFEGRATALGLIANWTISYFGNLVGALLLCIWVKGCDVFHHHEDAVQGIAYYKTGNDFGVVFLRAILCNWCVNLAVWQATAAQDVAGKFIGIFLPISAFVAIGFEHSVANMFLIPFGMMYGADISVSTFLVNNLIPATLGNIVAGALVFAGSYAMLYGSLSNTLVHFFAQSDESNLKKQKTREQFQIVPTNTDQADLEAQNQLCFNQSVEADSERGDLTPRQSEDGFVKWGE
eukprot:TRINITY_DN21143_c0_g2_i3.p1 TRINITY_DN21143_c0_g2~~TRINITY_DN21143_c0_g2_i3.p1  ORF type:complete len:446 (-),score=64.26 TRINITY_DN21143_c0_g2_i3:109-1323(-)